ncbi:hypothetical protein PG995_008847 [Apiospora arundinis]|uniref:Uncharacterized protein n=1 Tax=Apiospora arundinis TaxID=335852 RepID=A0ABR2JN16_9PEZI
MPQEGIGASSATRTLSSSSAESWPLASKTKLSYSLDRYLQTQPDSVSERQGAGLIGSHGRPSGPSKTEAYLKEWESGWQGAKSSGKA